MIVIDSSLFPYAVRFKKNHSKQQWDDALIWCNELVGEYDLNWCISSCWMYGFIFHFKQEQDAIQFRLTH